MTKILTVSLKNHLSIETPIRPLFSFRWHTVVDNFKKAKPIEYFESLKKEFTGNIAHLSKTSKGKNRDSFLIHFALVIFIDYILEGYQ